MGTMGTVEVKRHKMGPKKIDHTKTIALANQHGLTPTEIAKIQGCHSSNIIRVLQRYNIDYEHVKNYKENVIEILEGFQEKILKSINIEDLEKAPIQVKSMMYGIFHDKWYRLVYGDTNNAAIKFEVNINTGEVKSVSNPAQNDREVVEDLIQSCISEQSETSEQPEQSSSNPFTIDI